MIAISIVVTAIAVVIIAFTSNSLAQLVIPMDLPGEEYKSMMQTRNQESTAVAYSDPRVQQALSTAIQNETNVNLLDSQDEVIIKAWDKMDVLGGWEHGYVISLTQGKVIDVLVDRSSNSVTSVNISAREDEQRNWNFTENQKRLISDLINDPRFQRQFAGKADSKDYYIGVMRDKGIGDHAYITVLSPTDNSFRCFARIDQKTDMVLEYTERESVQMGT
jgi:hypothetical protein